MDVIQDLKYIKQYLLFHVVKRIKRDEIDKGVKKFKDIHKGERCFIIATGPSLTLEDVEKLKGEITFAVNSCYKLLPKTDWRPTYFVVTDPRFMREYGEEIRSHEKDIKTLLCSDDLHYSGANVTQFNSSKWYLNLPKKGLVRKIEEFRKVDYMSRDMSRGIVAGDTVVFSILQIAAYMGFKEIYLIGADCNYRGEKQHSDLTQYGYACRPDSGDLIISNYIKAKRYLDKIGVKVYNATRGGLLEVFERVDLDNVL